MKFMLALLAYGYVALASPSLPVHPGGIGGLFKGPNSETIIKGPDGSIITAAVEGGEVQTDLEPIVVAEQADVVAPKTVVDTVPVIEAVAVPAAAVEDKQSSDLIGPSGRISTQGQSAVIAGPASTTVSGPAVVAETIVKGPPLVATPSLSLSPPLLTPVLTGSVPISSTVSVTPAPLGTLTAELSPIAVTASPLSVSSISPLPVLNNIELTHASIPVAAAPVISATNAPTLSVTATSPHAAAVASSSPHLTISSATSVDGAIASASAGSNQVSAIVGNTDGFSSVTQLPILRSTGVSTVAPPIISSTLAANSRLEGRINLNRQLIQNQIDINNRQLLLNPALIPNANIIPPEIPVTRVPNGRSSNQGKLLTTPGLGTVGSSTNIQREESDTTVNITPNTLQVISQRNPYENSLIQNQETLLNNQIQSTHSSIPVLRNEEGLRLTPSNLQINPQITLDSISADQVIALQNRQNALNRQLAQQDAVRSRILNNRGPALFTPNPDLLPNREASLGNIPQSALATELAKSGIDLSQVQLTNIPLSEVSNLPPNGNAANSGIDSSQVQLSNIPLSAVPNLPQNANSAELANSGYDQSQVQLSNIPLSADSNLRQSGNAGVLANSGYDQSQVQLSNIPLSAVSNIRQNGNVAELANSGYDQLQVQLSNIPLSADSNLRQNGNTAELAKSGYDQSQLQLSNIPFSSVSNLPQNVINGAALGRYGRNANDRKEKKSKKPSSQ